MMDQRRTAAFARRTTASVCARERHVSPRPNLRPLHVAACVALTCITIVTSGCGDAEHSITVPAGTISNASRGAVSGLEANQAQDVARGIAVALANSRIRAHVRHAMRDSRWTDHKLVLQDYLHSNAGGELLEATASAMSLTSQALITHLDALPSLDFYLPFRSNRVSWRGAPDFLVASTFNKFAPTIQAFGVDGSTQELRLADGAPTRPLIILHPAEVKGVIAASEPRSTGETIESAAETGRARVMHPFGSVAATFDLLDCEPDTEQCDEGGGGGTGGGGDPPAPGVYLIAWDSYRTDGWFGGLEFEFRSYGFEGFPQYQGNSLWTFDHLCSKGTLAFTTDNTHHDGQLLLVSPGITNVGAVTCGFGGGIHGYMLQIVEMDGGLNGSNDDYGRRFFQAGTPPFGGIVTASGAAWSTGWQDYYSGGGSTNYPDAEYSISLTLQYR
jgi:hypothetical protein